MLHNNINRTLFVHFKKKKNSQLRATMPSKFHKVQKRVNKKKGSTNALHENSRDALRLRSAVQRDDRVHRMGALREKVNEPHCKSTSHVS